MFCLLFYSSIFTALKQIKFFCSFSGRICQSAFRFYLTFGTNLQWRFCKILLPSQNMYMNFNDNFTKTFIPVWVYMCDGHWQISIPFHFFFREIVMRKLSSSFQFWRENGNKRNKKTEEKTRENTTGYIFRICVASSRRIQAFKVLFHYFSYNLYKNKSSFVAIEPDIAYFCNWFEKRNCSKLLLPFIARREYLKLSKDTILFDALV